MTPRGCRERCGRGSAGSALVARVKGVDVFLRRDAVDDAPGVDACGQGHLHQDGVGQRIGVPLVDDRGRSRPPSRSRELDDSERMPSLAASLLLSLRRSARPGRRRP